MGELGGGADPSAGGEASSAVGQTGRVEGRCGGITGSLVLVLAVYCTEPFHFFHGIHCCPLLVGGCLTVR
jgi:hypothetical protein